MKRIGVYAGSFNPFHVGHADILHQAFEVFDEVMIAIGRNPEKDKEMIEVFPRGNPVLGNAIVVTYSGLLSDFLNSLNFYGRGKVFLIRGLRNGDDLQYEQNQLNFLKEMDSSIKPVFFICDRQFGHISSSALRALKRVSEKEYQKYVLISTKIGQDDCRE